MSLTPHIKIIFIVPYRDRKQHYDIFSEHMKTILEDIEPTDYDIFYIHQTDTRSFNRGAMKNIGFLYVKDKYPDTYKDITLVFNDIDTMPKVKNYFDYETETGVIKHLYGFTYTLGGIVSIKASDFEKMNGFPNFWAWGYEDNALQRRAEFYKVVIDRSKMCKIGDTNITHLTDELSKHVNKDEFLLYKLNATEGISEINSLTYNVNESTGFIDILTFNTKRDENLTTSKKHDIKNGNKPFLRRNPTMSMSFL